MFSPIGAVWSFARPDRSALTLDWPLRGDAKRRRRFWREGIGIGRRSRLKRQRRRQAAAQQSATPLDEALPTRAEAIAWTDQDGLHTLVPGDAPTPEQLDEMCRIYQQKIRQSPLWQQMLDEFGPAEAERLLKQFRAELL